MNIPRTKSHCWQINTVFNLLVGLLISLSALGQPAFLREGLVAYYPFNGNANDESGNSLHRTPYTLPSADRFGLNNSAVSNPKMTGGSIPQSSVYTLSSWIKVDKYLSQPVKNVWPGTVFQNSDAVILSVNPTRFWLSKNGYFALDSGFGLAIYEIGVQVEWFQLTVVYSGSIITAQVYANGKPCRLVWNGFGSKWLWAWNPDSINAEGSSIDDIRIYNRALSDGEVKVLYDYESTSLIQPPVFVSQPVSKVVNSGDNVVLSVELQAAGTYNYQWQLNEQNIAGATASSLSVNNAAAGVYRYRVIVSNAAGTVISDTATLTVSTPPAPSIATQPTPKTVQEGANVNFNVVATGQGSIVYQWQFNEQNIPGATSATLNLNGVKLNTAGRYRVLVSSQHGVTISDTVTLTVNANPPPTIVTQPISKSPAEGTQVSLTVTATGLGALTYQWQVNNQNIPGATSSTLVLSAVRPSANGKYRVIVGNPYGTTISTEATVTVVVTDADSDGLSDYEELLFGTNINKADSDGDGLTDFAEVRTHGSNPLTTDTDGDGYSDGIEVARDGNPNNRSVTPTGALAVFPAVDVEFYTLNGVKYQLEVSTDMAVWIAQGGVVVGNGGSQNHLVRASKATQFWRLKVVQ